MKKKAGYNLLYAVAVATTAFTSKIGFTANVNTQRDCLTWDASYQPGAALVSNLYCT